MQSRNVMLTSDRERSAPRFEVHLDRIYREQWLTCPGTSFTIARENLWLPGYCWQLVHSGLEHAVDNQQAWP